MNAPTHRHVKHGPTLARVVKNGNEAGSGLRVYLPKKRAEDLEITAGDYYHIRRDGRRLLLTRIEPQLREDTDRVDLALPPKERVKQEFDQEEASLLEGLLYTLPEPRPEVAVRVSHRLRRLMRAKGWPLPWRNGSPRDLEAPRDDPAA